MDTNIDELKQKLNDITGKERIAILSELGHKLHAANPQQARCYSQEALALAEELDFQEGIAQSHRIWGMTLWVQGEFDDALNHYQTSLKIYEALDNRQGISYNLHNIATIYQIRGENKLALEYAQRSLKIKEELGETSTLVFTLNVIGSIYNTMAFYESALKYYFRALEIVEKIEHQLALASTLSNIAVTYRSQGEYYEALEYSLRALRIAEEIGNVYGTASLLQNVGGLYLDINESEKALAFYQQAMILINEINDKKGLASVLNRIATIYKGQKKYEQALTACQQALKINEDINNKSGICINLKSIANVYRDQHMFDKALEYQQQALKLEEELGDQEKVAHSILNLAVIYQGLGKYQTAIDYVQKSLTLRQKIGMKYNLDEVYAVLTEIYRKMGDYESAFDSLQQFIKVKGELFNEEKSKQIADLQTKYDTEKKEKEAEIYRLKNIKLATALEELQRTQEHLVESRKMAALGNLVKGIAHEINTPVGVGITAASSLVYRTKKIIKSYQNNDLTAEDLETYLEHTFELGETIEQNMINTGELIERFKRIAMDNSPEQKRRFNLHHYLQDVLISLQPQFDQKSIKVVLKCPSDIEIESSPPVIAQIITNLIDNSLIYGFENMDRGEIKIKVIEQNGDLILRYFDNGRGIDQNLIPQIFNPFVTSNKQKGAGLGLHIVYNLVTQKLNGTIHCESKAGVMFEIIIKNET